MPHSRTGQFRAAPPGALSRPDWQAGGELTASALDLELSYFRQRMRRQLRVIHGCGIIYGLNVVPNAPLGGWNLFICPGYGVGPCGDEVSLLKAFPFDMRDYLWMRPANSESDRVWISIETNPDSLLLGSPPAGDCGCGCQQDRHCGCSCGCRGSQIVSTEVSGQFSIVVSWTSPPALFQPSFDLCSGDVPPCPLCPDVCVLPLAILDLPAPNETIFASAINNFSPDH
jgi:hypothetical protein